MKSRSFTELNWILRGLQFVIASTIIGLFVYLSTSGSFNHNDFMYVSTAMLSGHPYEDFNFVQSPLTYYFWNMVSNLLPDQNPYVGFRLVSALLVSIGILFPTLFFFTNNLDRAVFVLLALSSDFILVASAEVGNYSLTFAFLSIGVTSLFFKNKILISFGALCLGAAASAKISFILFLVPGFAMVLMLHNCFKNRELIVFFGAGVIIGVTPLVFFAVENFDNFLLHTLSFHSELTNNSRGLTLSGSLISIFRGMASWVNNELVVISIFAFLITIATQKFATKPSSQYDKKLVTTLLLFSAFALVVAWSPMILFNQYLVPVSFFLVWLTVILFGLINDAERNYFKWPVLMMSVVVFGLQLSGNALVVLKNNAVQNHQLISKQLDKVLETSSCEPIVTTLSGSFLADTRGMPGPGSFTGLFWVRVLQSTPQEMRDSPSLSLTETTFFPERAITDGITKFVVTGFYENDYENRINTTADFLDFDKIHLGLFQGKDIYLRKSPEC